jgi:hypothetical protein
MGVIFDILDEYMEDSWHYPMVLHGESPKGGVDAYVAAYCMGAGWGVQGFPPKPSGGRSHVIAKDFYIRNQAMIDEKPDCVLAFFLKGAQNKGTSMTVKLAEKAGIPVEIIWFDPEEEIWTRSGRGRRNAASLGTAMD